MECCIACRVVVRCMDVNSSRLLFSALKGALNGGLKGALKCALKCAFKGAARENLICIGALIVIMIVRRLEIGERRQH